MVLVSNQSLHYGGDLTIESVPRGATHSLTLSDVANPRREPSASVLPREKQRPC